ncbi:MAG: hypothetical protein ACXWP5_04035 [Bdellovibrionota bacterium]
MSLSRALSITASAILVCTSSFATESGRPSVSLGGGLETFTSISSDAPTKNMLGGVGQLKLDLPVLSKSPLDHVAFQVNIGGVSSLDGKNASPIGDLDLTTAFKLPVKGLTAGGGVRLTLTPTQLSADILKTGIQYRKGPAHVELNLIALGIGLDRIEGTTGYYSGVEAKALLDFNRFTLGAAVGAFMTFDKERAALYGIDPSSGVLQLQRTGQMQNGPGLLLRAALEGRVYLDKDKTYYLGFEGSWARDTSNILTASPMGSNASFTRSYDDFRGMLTFGGTFKGL